MRGGARALAAGLPAADRFDAPLPTSCCGLRHRLPEDEATNAERGRHLYLTVLENLHHSNAAR